MQLRTTLGMRVLNNIKLKVTEVLSLQVCENHGIDVSVRYVSAHFI